VLQNRYNELQQQEDDLLVRAGELNVLPDHLYGQSGSRHYSVPNQAKADLPYLHSHLDDVRREKNQVWEQLEQFQH
jgi:hypothetical protein